MGLNMDDVINEAYANGGKYRLYEAYVKDDVDKALSKNDTYT